MSETQTEETTTGPVFTDEVEKAAKDFTTLAPQVRSRIKELASKNGKGLARVVIAASEFPYAEHYPKFVHEREQTLFVMMLQLNGLKNILAEAMKPQMKEIEDEVVQHAVNDAMANVVDQLPNTNTAAEFPATEEVTDASPESN